MGENCRDRHDSGRGVRDDWLCHRSGIGTTLSRLLRRRDLHTQPLLRCCLRPSLRVLRKIAGDTIRFCECTSRRGPQGWTLHLAPKEVVFRGAPIPSCEISVRSSTPLGQDSLLNSRMSPRLVNETEITWVLCNQDLSSIFGFVQEMATLFKAHSQKRKPTPSTGSFASDVLEGLHYQALHENMGA